LICWSCSTGQMHNHTAIAAHTDGNKSHEIETLSLFGRLNSRHKKIIHKEVNNMVPGVLCFPIDGLAIKIRCGKDVIHCCLKQTIHLPDNSRNHSNWSKVQGPKLK
jgi:hypothetical protein